MRGPDRSIDIQLGPGRKHMASCCCHLVPVAHCAFDANAASDMTGLDCMHASSGLESCDPVCSRPCYAMLCKESIGQAAHYDIPEYVNMRFARSSAELANHMVLPHTFRSNRLVTCGRPHSMLALPLPPPPPPQSWQFSSFA